MNHISKSRDGNSNVIEVRFNSASTTSSLEEYEKHLNSLIDTDDDPIDTLLNEFSDEDFYNSLMKSPNEEHESLNPQRVRFSDDITTMCLTLSDQIREIKTTSEKLSYYLSEMNFED